jgi:hypothetical protein
MNGSPITYSPLGLGSDDIVKVGQTIKAAGYVSKVDTSSMGVLHMFIDGGQKLASEYGLIADNFELDCRQGMPDTMFDRGAAMELTDLWNRTLVHLEEYDIERIIHMNQENIGSFLSASDLGFSIGHWQGDDLIVETPGVGWPYYDEVGIPQPTEVSHHEQFSVFEDGNLLNYVFTITGPLVFSDPLVLATTGEWDPGRVVEEYGCTGTWEE